MCDVRTNYYRKKERDYIETIYYYLVIQDIAQQNKMYNIIIACVFTLQFTHYIILTMRRYKTKTIFIL